MRDRTRSRGNRLALTGTAILVACVAGSLLVAPAAGALPKQADLDLTPAASVARFVSDPALGTNVGVHVRSVAGGTESTDVRADRGLIPASTMKLITAYTALRRLGADHRFTTSVHWSTSNRLVLRGGGDPVLTSADLRVLATRTARGVRTSGIGSAVVVDFDDGIFSTPRDAAGWEPSDMPRYIAAVRGLGMLGSYSTDTALAATRVFVSHLSQLGLTAVVGERVELEESALRLARFRGNDVGEAVATMMPPSENNIAEVLYRQVALSTGKPANWIGARRATRQVLRRDGIEIQGSAFIDGSGLSYRNRLTPELLTDVLSRMATDERFTVARTSLPTAGINGTLSRRFAAPPASCARGAVSAKTGSLPMTVSTLAGLTKASDGTLQAFAILVNDRPPQYSWTQTSAAIDTIAAAVHGCVR